MTSAAGDARYPGGWRPRGEVQVTMSLRRRYETRRIEDSMYKKDSLEVGHAKSVIRMQKCLVMSELII